MEQIPSLVNYIEDGERARILAAIGGKKFDQVVDFLLGILKTDTSVDIKREIIDRLGLYSDPRIREVLERHAAHDEHAEIAILALERMHAQQSRALRRLLEQRLEIAYRNGDEVSLLKLAEEHERLIYLGRGAMLPAFMRKPPPVFSLNVAQDRVRVLAFGDSGDGSPKQKEVAAAMLGYHRTNQFAFAITLGDNFYNTGMATPIDPRWKVLWEDIYSVMDIECYITLGNHDWSNPESLAAEILYSASSRSWRLPAPYYSFTAGPLQFFALDTNAFSVAQALWLKAELTKSSAKWKVVYGHHQIYSAGPHGDNPYLIEKLLPLLKGFADIYIAGHDHNMQHLESDGGVGFIISGGAGSQIRPVQPNSRSLFAQSVSGFTVLEGDMESLTVRFVDTNGDELYECGLCK